MIMKGHQETFGGDGFIRIYTFQKLIKLYTLYTYAICTYAVLCRLYFNKLLFLKTLKGSDKKI